MVLFKAAQEIEFYLSFSPYHLGWMGPHYSERKLHGAGPNPSPLCNRLVRTRPLVPPPCQRHRGQQQCRLMLVVVT